MSCFNPVWKLRAAAQHGSATVAISTLSRTQDLNIRQRPPGPPSPATQEGNRASAESVPSTLSPWLTHQGSWGLCKIFQHSRILDGTAWNSTNGTRVLGLSQFPIAQKVMLSSPFTPDEPVLRVPARTLHPLPPPPAQPCLPLTVVHAFTCPALPWSSDCWILCVQYDQAPKMHAE